MWLALDDTDSIEGGCTSKIFHDLLLEIEPFCEIIDSRLVRLWPFAPQRTRGNAAFCCHLSVCDEDLFFKKVQSYWNEKIEPVKGVIGDSHHSDRPQHPADPGLVIFAEQPHSSWYYKGVRQEVSLNELPTPLLQLGGNGRIGATCAAAWPAEKYTWECIAWKGETSRAICGPTLEQISAFNGLFLTTHSKTGKQLISPKGKSPVLFGIRSLNETSCVQACHILLEAERTSKHEGWRLFRTNQATNDHIVDTIRLEVERIEVTKNGHVIIHCLNNLTAKVFYESGTMNRHAKHLVAKDIFSVRGLIDSNKIIHVENLRFERLVPRRDGRLMCTTCSRRMKSMGAEQRLRCPQCKSTAERGYQLVDSDIPVNTWLEPPDDQRRHLTTPLNKQFFDYESR